MRLGSGNLGVDCLPVPVLPKPEQEHSFNFKPTSHPLALVCWAFNKSCFAALKLKGGRMPWNWISVLSCA